MLTTLMSSLCSTEDESAIFQSSVDISIINYSRYLHEFIWRERAAGNHFVAILTEIVRHYQT